jgi:hypothetical protein
MRHTYPLTPSARSGRAARVRFRWTTLAALFMLAAVGIMPSNFAAMQERNADPGARLAQHEEDLLLLAAFRYLGLSQEQLRQVQWVARQTDRSLTRLQKAEDRGIGTLEQIAARTRQALLAGQPAAERDQQEAARVRDTMQQTRTQTSAEIVRFALPHLVRILTREQILLAWRLAQGRPPAYAKADPSLLDTGAGFAVSAPQRGWNGDGPVLELWYGRQSMMLPTGPGAQGNSAFRDAADLAAAEARAAELQLATARLQRHLEGASGALDPESVARGGGSAGDRHFPQRVVEATNPDELADAVEPLARRLFLSPRLAPLLEEGLARGMGRASARGGTAAPAGPPRHVRDYQIFKGFGDLLGRGPELTPLGGQLQNGYYVFAAGQGLGLTDLGATDHYTIQLLFRCVGASGYQKLVDFKNRTRDPGLYVYGGRLTFYDLAAGRVVEPGQDHRLRLERNRATHLVRAYLDGPPVFAFLDLDDEAVFQKGVGFFFMDDQTTNGEQGPGAVAWLEVWDGPDVR